MKTDSPPESAESGGSDVGQHRLVLLDLFCCAGGAGEGYRRAGFDVVGVDIEPQPLNPHTFIQGDAVEYLEAHGHEYDAIHASPPCQAHTRLAKLTGKEYPCFIEATRDLLMKLDVPWIIENVVGAPLRNPVTICGSAFGLGVRRHRQFESNVWLWPTDCRHDLQPEPIDVTGTGGFVEGRIRTDGGGGNSRKPRNIAEAREAMGINWMTRPKLSQAIPPAYTEYLGQQVMGFLKQNSFRRVEITDVRMLAGMGKSVSKDSAAGGVDLDLPPGAEPGLLESEVEPADACEE